MTRVQCCRQTDKGGTPGVTSARAYTLTSGSSKLLMTRTVVSHTYLLHYSTTPASPTPLAWP